MTDRVLTEEEVDGYERTAPKLDTCNSSYPAVVALIASHRLLREELKYERELSDNVVKRVTQLEQEIGALMR